MSTKPRNVALLSAGLVIGGAAAGALVVSAADAATADSSLTAATSSYSSEGSTGSGEGGRSRGHGFGQGSNPDEKSVSSAVEPKLRAAALKAVPGGTVVRIETDSGDAVYEAHMKKADGSLVTVKFDKDYVVTAVEDGMGKNKDGTTGGGRHGGPNGGAPSSGGESGSSSST